MGFACRDLPTVYGGCRQDYSSFGPAGFCRSRHCIQSRFLLNTSSFVCPGWRPREACRLPWCSSGMIDSRWSSCVDLDSTAIRSGKERKLPFFGGGWGCQPTTIIPLNCFIHFKVLPSPEASGGLRFRPNPPDLSASARTFSCGIDKQPRLPCPFPANVLVRTGSRSRENTPSLCWSRGPSRPAAAPAHWNHYS